MLSLQDIKLQQIMIISEYFIITQKGGIIIFVNIFNKSIISIVPIAQLNSNLKKI